MRDLILTAFLTGRLDPQRGIMWEVSNYPLLPLLHSCPVPLVVFANELVAPFVKRVENPQSVYFDRWRHVANYLEANEDVRFTFCVDATDVLVLNNPFPHMGPGKLYCGSEPGVVGCQWMFQYHEPLREWIAANKDKPLLNCGIAGGDRATVLRLAQRMGEEQRGMEMDMGAFNFIAYEEFEVVTGPVVHTLYKAEETESAAWFKHK